MDYGKYKFKYHFIILATERCMRVTLHPNIAQLTISILQTEPLKA